jgi:hypothetical protein
MNDFLKFAPLINLAILVVGAAMFMLRLGDAVRRFQAALEKMTLKMDSMSDRLTKQETICTLRHEEEGA